MPKDKTPGKPTTRRYSDEEKAHLQHQHFGRLATSGKTGPVLASAPTIFMLNEEIR